MRLRTVFGRLFSLPQLLEPGAARPARTLRSRKLRVETLEYRELLSIAPWGTEFQVNTWTTGEQFLDGNFGKKVAADSAGNFVVVWTSTNQAGGSGADVYAQRFSASGTPQGSEFRINAYTTSDQSAPSVAMDQAGNFVVVWDDNYNVVGHNGGLYARRFDATGVPLGNDTLVTNTNMFDFVIGMNPSGAYVVAWESIGQPEDASSGIFARRYDANGVSQGSTFHVNTVTTEIQDYPSVAVDADGDFIVAWQQRLSGNYTIYSQRYNSAGTPVGGETLLGTSPIGQAYRRPRVAYGLNGTFAAAWNGFAGIMMRRFDADGVALASEFAINESTSATQFIGDLASNASGEFVVTWNTIEPNTLAQGVYAKRMSGTGTLLGSQFRVNTYTTNEQQYPSVAVDAAGDLIFAWQSNGPDGSGNGVFAQRYQAQANQAPTVLGFGNVTTYEDAGNLTLSLATGFSDFEDGSTRLTYSVQSNSNATLVSASSVSGSQLTLAFGANAFGNSTLTIRATDSEGAYVEGPVTISVVPVNDAPVLAISAGIRPVEGSSYTVTPADLLATDPDNSPSQLTFILTGAPWDGSLQKNSVTIPVGGTFTQQDVNDGLIRYLHNGNEGIGDSLNLRLSDTGDPNPISISRVSVATGGAQANGNSTLAAISADGKLVAFTSTASNLVAGDTNNRTDVFVRNIATGETTRASVDSLGVEANGNSTDAHFSPDGRYLVFSSTANNLVAGDTNGVTDIFLRDLQSNTTTLLSGNSTGGFANGNSTSPAFSLDGRYVTFLSAASDLVAGDTNNAVDVFVRDLTFGTTTRASISSTGAQTNGNSSVPTMSGAGRYVAFTSTASTLVTADTNGQPDVFLRDLVTNTTTRVSVNTAGNQTTSGASFAYYPSLSADGRYLTFDSLASTIVASDTNGTSDVFLRDLQSGVNSRLSLSLGGAQLTATSRTPVISADGRYVAFVSNASTIVSNDANSADDVYIRDLQTNTSRRVSLATSGGPTIGNSTLAAISADGRYVAFEAVANNIVAGDTNGASDIFVRDLGTVIASMAIQITYVNEAPTLDPISDPPVLSENAPEQVINLTGIADGGTETAALTVTATSSNPTLVEHPIITYTSPQTTATLRFTPSTGQSGTAVITVKVDDGGSTANGGVNFVTRTFTVTVNDTIEDVSPTVTGVYAASAAGVAVASAIDQNEQELLPIAKLVVAFSENMATTGAANVTDAQNWQLKRNGADISGQITGITFGLNATTSRYEALLSFASPLADGTYELTARSSLTDLVGNRLDGDAIASGFSENFTRRFTVAQIAAAGLEFRVNSFTTSTQGGDGLSNRSVAANAAGDFVIVWSSQQDASFLGVYAQRYDRFGTPLGSEFRVNTYTTLNQTEPSVAMDSTGNFMVSWASKNQDGGDYGVYAKRFDAAGNVQGSEFRVNTYTTGAQRFPSIAVGGLGDYVVTWTSENQDGNDQGVYAQRYSAAGAPLGTEFRVNTYTTFQQRSSSVAMAADGDFVITWRSQSQDGMGGLYAQRYNADGTTAGSEFRVNTYTTTQVDTSSVAMNADGDFVVAWDGADLSDGFGIYAQRYSSTGLPQGSQFRVNTYTSGAQRLPSVAMDSDGDFVVTWQDPLQEGDGYGVYAQRFTKTGATDGSEFRVNTFTTNWQKSPSAAMSRQGEFIITWTSLNQDSTNSYGMYAQRYAPTSRVTSVQIVGDISPIEPGERLAQVIPSGASLSISYSRAMSQSGGAGFANAVTNPVNYLLTRDGLDVSNLITGVSYSGLSATLTFSSSLTSGNYVLTAKSTIQDTDGRPLDGDANGAAGGDFVQAFTILQPAATGSEFLVNTTTSQAQRTFDDSPRSVATSASGEFVVVWSSLAAGVYGVYAQRYNAAGVPQGSEFRVTPASTLTQINPTVAMDADGDFVVSWTSADNGRELGTGIFAQRFNADGVAQGSVFHANTYTTGAQAGSSIGMDASGDFVIVWSSDAQDGNNGGIYAQRFSATGVRQGSEFRVNTYTTNSQSLPSVSMNASGDFLVAWSSDAQGAGSSFDDIFAQRFSRTGALVGSEFRVNTVASFTQDHVSAALSNTGDFAIAWTSTFQDGDWEGVYMQRYDANGAAAGSNFLVNTYTQQVQAHPVVSMDADGDFVVVWRSLNSFIVGASQDGNGYGVYGQRYSAQGVRQGSEFRINTYTTGNQSLASVAMDDDGDFVVVWSSNGQDGSSYGIYAQRFGSTPPMQVASITPTNSGVEVEFTREFNPGVLNLYDEGVTLGAADVTLVGATVGSVRGSVLLDPTSRKFTFIKSGGPLAPDNYTLTLRSAATGFVDAAGNLLDGNGDGLLGDNFITHFTVGASSGITLSVPDFARGFGQSVNLGGSGLPITISNALGVRSASFTLAYDPTLLTISSAALGAGLSGSVTLDTSTAGLARITVTSGTQLSSTSGSKTLVTLIASVPTGAPYASKHILNLADIQLSDTLLASIPAIDDDGIHIAAYFGDANGSQTYNSPDATAAQRIIVGSNSGLISYQLADPYLIVDISGNALVQSNDVTMIQQAIVGIFTGGIPTVPVITPAPSGGPDPIVSLPQDLVASVGETITVPVQLLVTEPTGITLAGVDLAIAYDPSRLELDAVHLGELLVGFGFNANLNMPGVIKLSSTGSSPLALPFDASGVLAQLEFTVLSATGPTRLNLLANSESLHTALYDDSGHSLLLQPSPTNEDDDAVDGLIEILAVDQVLAQNN